jgi:CrcB protein
MRRAETFRLYVTVGCGAAVGSLLRFLAAVATVSGLGLPGFAATGFVNVVGSFVIGFFATLSGPDGRLMISPIRRQFVMAGMCGGFTTFSSMSLDTFLMLAERRVGLAALYLGSVVVLSLAATWLGYVTATRINR